MSKDKGPEETSVGGGPGGWNRSEDGCGNGVGARSERDWLCIGVVNAHSPIRPQET